MFKDDLTELDDSRDVVDNLVQEYEAATQANYLSWQGRMFFFRLCKDDLYPFYFFHSQPNDPKCN